MKVRNNVYMEKITDKLNNQEYKNFDNHTISYNHPSTMIHQLPHYHEVYEIMLAKTGGMNIILNHRSYSIKRDDIFLIPPYTSHFLYSNSTSTSFERVLLFLSPSYVKKLLMDSPDLQSALSFIEINNQYKDTLIPQKAIWVQYIFSLLEGKLERRIGYDDLHKTYIQLLFFLLIQDLYEKKEERISPNTESPILPIAQYINEHIYEKITLESLAKEFYLSPSYISASFKKMLSVSFREYLSTQRVRLSQKLISEGFDLNEIPNKVGFDDYSTFFRSFKNKVGMSPREYKQYIIKQIPIPSKNAVTRYGY